MDDGEEGEKGDEGGGQTGRGGQRKLSVFYVGRRLDRVFYVDALRR